MRSSSSLAMMATACIGFALPFALAAQQPVLLHAAHTEAVTDAAPAIVATTATAPVKEAAPWTARWLDLKTLSHSERYRNAYDQGGFHMFEDGQQRSLVEGRVKLDSQARYTVGFRASSGRYFNWAYADYAGEGFMARTRESAFYTQGYNNAEVGEIIAAVQAHPAEIAMISGLHSNGWQFYMRELYFSATPVKAVTAEFGSFGFERGLSTEITTFDDDGYLSGERIRIHDAKHLFFDEIGYTNAFFGDVGAPNLFTRGSSLKNFNYRQVFAKKQLNERVGFSGEYTWQVGTDTLREAAAVKTSELKVVDGIRFEAYERLNTTNLQGLVVKGASGGAVSFEKKLGTHLSGDIGLASIDKDYSLYYGSRILHAYGFSLNGDSYGQGDRVFSHLSYKINPTVTAFGFYTHAFGGRVLNFNQQNLSGGLSFDLKALVNTEKRVF